MISVEFHRKMMKRAIALARKGMGKTSPNPAVGCVIVNNGQIVGEGWHKKAGTPHAEVHALRQAGLFARNADVYVTLEPCAHFGKTPPCAEALISAGVKKVFAGMVDPNPEVSGKGLRLLEKAGVAVEAGVLEPECRRLNEPFIKHIATGLPFVILKSAMTLDGMIATASGDSKWITNEKSRRYVHKLRAMVDCVMVGVGTVIADNPQLTARIPGGKDPLRVVVDSTLRTPLRSQLLHQPSAAGTIIATISREEKTIREIGETGAEVIFCAGRNGQVDLKDIFQRLGARGIQSVLLEGGAELAGAAVREGLVDRFLLFYAPKLLAGEGKGAFGGKGAHMMRDALLLRDIKVSRFGDDILVEGYPEASCSRV